MELAYLLFYIARWGMRVSILVFAYERGGVEETGLVAVIMEVPAAVVAPLASVIGDEVRRDRVLFAGYVAQAAALAGTAGAIYADAPAAAVYGLAAVATGFAVPETLVSNDPMEIREFCRRFGQQAGPPDDRIERVR